jgi:hypothetical protein
MQVELYHVLNAQGRYQLIGSAGPAVKFSKFSKQWHQIQNNHIKLKINKYQPHFPPLSDQSNGQVQRFEQKEIAKIGHY